MVGQLSMSVPSAVSLLGKHLSDVAKTNHSTWDEDAREGQEEVMRGWQESRYCSDSYLGTVP